MLLEITPTTFVSSIIYTLCLVHHHPQWTCDIWLPFEASTWTDSCWHNHLAKIIQLIPYPLNSQPLKSICQQFNPGLGWLGLIPWLIGWMNNLWERGKGKWGKGMENQPKNKTAATSWRKKFTKYYRWKQENTI